MNASDVTLREYVEAMFQAYKEAHQREHTMMAFALGEAQRGVEAKMVVMNETRTQILEERAELARKGDVNTRIEAVNTRIDALERLMREMMEAKLAPILVEMASAKQNRDAFNGRLAVLIGGAVIILGVFQFLLKYMIQ